MSEQTNPSVPPGKGQLERDAAEWCVRMHGDEAEQHREAFEGWLRRGALHRQAYNRIEEVYLLGSRVRRDRVAPATSLETAAPSPRHKARMVAAASLVAAAAALGLTVLHEVPRGRSSVPTEVAEELRTATRIETAASPQLVELADGSRVSLAPASTILVSLTSDRRQLSLVTGRARFVVARERRPFTVAAGGGLITATGTLFEITISAAAVDVHLLKGRITVAYPMRPGSSAGPLRHMLAGEHVSFSPEGANDAATSRRGEAQAKTVGELIALANRASGGKLRIELANPTIAAIRLGGVFEAHDPTVTATRLADMLGLALDRSRPGVLRLVRKPRGGGSLLPN